LGFAIIVRHADQDEQAAPYAAHHAGADADFGA
jgi:hypothetical protein